MNLSVIQRFLADTPPFFKKVHAFGLVICGIALTMSQYPAIPSKYSIIVGTVGAVLAVISQFAVNDIAALQNATVSSIPGMLGDLGSEVTTIKGYVTKGVTADDLAKIIAIPSSTDAAPAKPVTDQQPATIVEQQPAETVV